MPEPEINYEALYRETRRRLDQCIQHSRDLASERTMWRARAEAATSILGNQVNQDIREMLHAR